MEVELVYGSIEKKSLDTSEVNQLLILAIKSVLNLTEIT